MPFRTSTGPDAKGTLGERLVVVGLLGCTILAALSAAAVIGVLGLETSRFFGEVPLARFFTDLSWTPSAEETGFGVLPLLAATAQIGAGATALSLPVGLMVAVFLEYYAGRRTVSIMNAVVTALGSVPAIVYGYFALNFVTPALKKAWPRLEAFNGLSACLVVGLMILPTIVVLSREALRAAPRSLLRQAVALGATRERALLRLALPAAWLGILGSGVLAMTRAVGETVIVTLAAGNPAGVSWNPLEGVRTLTTFLAQSSMGDLSPGTMQYSACFGVAAMLFLLTYGMHALGAGLVSRGRPEGRRGSRWMGVPAHRARATGLRSRASALGLAAAIVAVAALCALTAVLALNALGFPEAGIPARRGLAPAVVGSLWLAFFTALIALPMGVSTAVYLEEYAPRTRAARVLASVLTNLAGVPSVVYGFAGLALFARGMELGPSILAGGLTLAAMTTPMVVASSRKALEAVPESLRWTAFGLGATRWQVVRDQVLRAAAPDILKGCSAALARAVGAAAPLLIVGAAAFTTFAPRSPHDPLTALPAQIFAWTARPQADFVALAAGASVALLLVMAFMDLVPWALRRGRGEARG